MSTSGLDTTTGSSLRDLTALVAASAGFQAVVTSVREGHSGTLDGAWGSACALGAAALADCLPNTLVVVLSSGHEIEAFVDEFALFSDRPIVPFPALESSPIDDDGSRLDAAYPSRMAALKMLLAGESPVMVASVQSLLQRLPSRAALQQATIRLAVNDPLSPEAFCERLVALNLKCVTAVEYPGEYSLRGGIVDVFSPDAKLPLRVEFFGDAVESLRSFDPATQRSCGKHDFVELTAPPVASESDHLSDFLPGNACYLLVEPQALEEEGKYFLRTSIDATKVHSLAEHWRRITEFSSVVIAGIAAGAIETTHRLPLETVERFSGDIQKVREEVDTAGRGQQIRMVCDSAAEQERLMELFTGSLAANESRLHWSLGRLRTGFRFVNERIVVLSAAQLFHRADVRRGARRFLGKAIDSFLDLREGDLVVHVGYGVARYLGLRLLDQSGGVEEHLELEFHGGVRVYVPASRIGLVQKYVGGSKARPNLARIGGTTWTKQKAAAAESVKDMAADLLRVQARRASLPGLAFPPATEWQREFAASFPWRETPDQSRSIVEIESDMLNSRPMDRLLCGDVGFGKTEVAMRAAFKAIDSGFQVAVLAPTTILAEQHFRTFSQRMAEYPFSIAALSRFASPKRQREIIAGAAEGTIDVVIGTHRLAQKDVQFRNLGLVVIDEEQRFGVEIKERLKAIRSSVDVLTMTATPIPRTLHMSLLGLRDISNLETAPEDRMPIETKVTRFAPDLIRHAILRELSRGGQIYFIHNRVNDIHAIKNRLEQIVPEARICVGHGQMDEDALEQVIVEFIEGKYDVLLATTIVESGLDIPNANTMFIHHADHHGLADLHQLRGRVGRSNHRAYCYLLVDEHKQLTNEAAKRLRTIEEFHEIGAGFAIAMRDLEIRGAGNILGSQQSGHISAVGYELYCELLESAVRELKKEPPKENVEVTVDIPVQAYLPRNYVSDVRQKIDLYRRMTRMSSMEEWKSFREELADRFGAPPAPVEKLLELAHLRILAHFWRIFRIRVEDDYLVFDYFHRDSMRKLAKLRPGQIRIADEISAYCPASECKKDSNQLLALARTLLLDEA